MKRGMTIEYLMCRADLNFEVDLGANGAIGTIVTSGISLYLEKASFLSIIKCFFKLNKLHSPLTKFKLRKMYIVQCH